MSLLSMAITPNSHVLSQMLGLQTTVDAALDAAPLNLEQVTRIANNAKDLTDDLAELFEEYGVWEDGDQLLFAWPFDWAEMRLVYWRHESGKGSYNGWHVTGALREDAA